jgi:hypothetical protein
LGAFRGHPHAPASWIKHCLIEPIVRLDGDAARVNSYYAKLVGEPWSSEGPKLATFGRYQDELVRCGDGRWRFQERRALNEAGRPGYPKEPYRAF